MAVLGPPIILDGSHPGGGGAVVRTAVALSVLTQQALRIQSVRGGLDFPGLSAEDVMIVKALQSMSKAETVGLEEGSKEFSFLPTSRPRGVDLTLPWKGDDAYSPCAPIVLNALLAPTARGGKYTSIEAEGETYGNGILTFDYFANVTLGMAKRMGVYAYADLLEAGFGRGSKGSVRMEVEPSAIQGVEWTTRGRMISFRAAITTANLPASVSQRAESHLTSLAKHADLPLTCESHDVPSKTTGAFVTVWAEFERGLGGATFMGKKGVRMEAVAQGAFDRALAWIRSEASVDEFLADQVLLLAAIATGDTSFSVPRLTARFLSTVWVIKHFLPIRITVKGKEGDPGWITIRR